jgi:hypothetical protein
MRRPYARVWRIRSHMIYVRMHVCMTHMMCVSDAVLVWGDAEHSSDSDIQIFFGKHIAPEERDVRRAVRERVSACQLIFTSFSPPFFFPARCVCVCLSVQCRCLSLRLSVSVCVGLMSVSGWMFVSVFVSLSAVFFSSTGAVKRPSSYLLLLFIMFLFLFFPPQVLCTQLSLEFFVSPLHSLSLP